MQEKTIKEITQVRPVDGESVKRIMRYMKKKLIAVLTAGLLLSGCGSSAGTQGTGPESGTPAAASSGADPASFKTMGDIYAANPEERERGFMDTDYCYVFELDGTVYRARGTLTEEQRDALFDLQYDDPDYEEKYREISGPIAIEQFDNLTEMIPPQEELDKYVGKTGQNLLDDGWTEGYGYNLDNMEFWLYKGPFAYTVVFESDQKYENTDDFDVWATIAPLTIKSVTYNGLGNASEQ